MKIYVCYLNYGYEGYSEPLHAFTDECAANAWLEGTKNGHGASGEVKVIEPTPATVAPTPQPMTPEEREKLVEDMAEAIDDADNRCKMISTTDTRAYLERWREKVAKAALAVAEKALVGKTTDMEVA